MDIRLIDRHRNVTMLPKPPGVDANDPFAALDDLLFRAGNVSEGQHEFECDQPYWDAIQNAVTEDPEAQATTDEFKPWRAGHEGTYHGVPIIVERPADDAGAKYQK